jgi:hypothetical protein
MVGLEQAGILFAKHGTQDEITLGITIVSRTDGESC